MAAGVDAAKLALTVDSFTELQAPASTAQAPNIVAMMGPAFAYIVDLGVKGMTELGRASHL